MFDDPERYEHDGFYEENTDYEDEYETDDSDYIVDAEEDENPFGTMRKKLLTIFPKRSGRTKLFLLTMIRIPKKPNYPNKHENCGQKPLHDWRIPPEHNGSEPQSYVLDGRNHPLHVTMTCGERSPRLSAGSPLLPNAGRCGNSISPSTNSLPK